MTTSAVVTVPFHGSNLFVVEHNNEPFVPMKSIVENMGLDWASQYTKLKSNAKRWGIVIITIPTVSHLQQAVCLPLRKLCGWMTSISPNKVKPEIRDTVIMYQNECDDVLYRYWQGEAVQRPYQMPLPTMSDKRTRVPLKDAVTLLVAKSRNMNYSEAYGMIHQRFDVDSVENLTADQVPLAVEYIHRVVCEFIGKDALPAPKPMLVINYPAITARPNNSFLPNQHWYKAEDFTNGQFDPVRDFLDKLEAEGYEVTGLKIINKAKTWIINQQHQAINHIRIGQKQVTEGLRIATDYGMNVSGFTFGKPSM